MLPEPCPGSSALFLRVHVARAREFVYRLNQRFSCKNVCTASAVESQAGKAGYVFS